MRAKKLLQDRLFSIMGISTRTEPQSHNVGLSFYMTAPISRPEPAIDVTPEMEEMEIEFED